MAMVFVPLAVMNAWSVSVIFDYVTYPPVALESCARGGAMEPTARHT